MENNQKATIFGKYLLKTAREEALAGNFDRNRLPDWVKNAKVHVGHYHRTTVFLFNTSTTGEDSVEFHGEIGSIMELLTEIPSEYIEEKPTPIHYPNHTQNHENGSVILGGGDDEAGKAPVIDLTMRTPSMFNIRDGFHTPQYLANLFLRFSPEGKPIASGYLPFAAMIHDFDFDQTQLLTESFRFQIQGYFKLVVNSVIGDYYQRVDEPNVPTVNKEDTVIVLGDYDSGKNESELHQVKRELEANGYSAHLIKDLPTHSAQSLPQKVKMWCLSSRFVVLIDRDPSGHIAEYTDLMGEDLPIGLLQEEDSGSTYMIGHKHLTDDFVGLFNFEQIPSEVLGDTITWAEKLIEEMAEKYDEYYHWRSDNDD